MKQLLSRSRLLIAALAVALAVPACGPAQHDETAASPSPSPAVASPSPSPAASVSLPPSISASAAVPAASGSATVTPTPWPAASNAPLVVVTGSPLATIAPDYTAAHRVKNASASASTPQPHPQEEVVMLPPDAPPKILKVEVSQTTVRGGDTVSGFVQTSSNVASVELRIAGFSISMPKASTGRFQLSYTVPSVPFFLHRTYPMNIIARNTRGEATSTSVPITVR